MITFLNAEFMMIKSKSKIPIPSSLQMGIPTDNGVNGPSGYESPGKKYCLTNDCYTPTEFILFGLGICILGVMIGVVAVAWFKNLCLDKDEYDAPTPR